MEIKKLPTKITKKNTDTEILYKYENMMRPVDGIKIKKIGNKCAKTTVPGVKSKKFRGWVIKSGQKIENFG